MFFWAEEWWEKHKLELCLLVVFHFLKPIQNFGLQSLEQGDAYWDLVNLRLEFPLSIVHVLIIITFSVQVRMLSLVDATCPLVTGCWVCTITSPPD